MTMPLVSKAILLVGATSRPADVLTVRWQLAWAASGRGLSEAERLVGPEA